MFKLAFEDKYAPVHGGYFGIREILNTRQTSRRITTGHLTVILLYKYIVCQDGERYGTSSAEDILLCAGEAIGTGHLRPSSRKTSPWDLGFSYPDEGHGWDVTLSTTRSTVVLQGKAPGELKTDHPGTRTQDTVPMNLPYHDGQDLLRITRTETFRAMLASYTWTWFQEHTCVHISVSPQYTHLTHTNK